MAVVSRLFMLLGNSTLHNPRSFAQTPLLNFSKPCLLQSLRLNRRISSAVTLDSEASAISTAAAPAHPWPEWVNFVDQLKSKGYIIPTAAAGNGGDAVDESASIYRDMKLVKDACLSFARDRFDIFKSLPTAEIQAIVEKGCPGVFRKQVNSAKRLRAHLQLDEGDACSACSLRGSCDRAYVLLSESEAVARTVDVVRILLGFAVDPLVSAEVENNAPGRELIESSARRLLSVIVELGETPIDPNLPKPAPIDNQRKKQPLDLSDNGKSQNKDMKPGDWICTECSFTNFAKNIRCLKCKASGPKSTYTGRGVPEMKKGDWNCPQCSFMNFASNRQCFRCQSSRPERQLKPGDWECPKCDFLNFSRNAACKKCNLERSQASTMQTGPHTWKQPQPYNFVDEV